MIKNNKKGFTLVEIIIVIGLLVVIAGIFSLNLVTTLKKQKTEENENVVNQILSAANVYISANPDEIENLYNGYGYVDIPVGHLRDAGLLSEELKDADTGEIIPDDEKIRVKLDLDELLDFTYPAPEDEEDADAWKVVVDNLNVPYDENGSVDKWCKINEADPYTSNPFVGLILNPKNDYTHLKSKMYAMNKTAEMYTGGKEGYKSEFNLRMESCDVNPSKVGTYTVTYKYNDPSLETEKTVKRTVYVESDNKDIISFVVELNGGTPIIRGTRKDLIPIKIIETYRDGTREINTTVGKIGTTGIEYSIADFETNITLGKNTSTQKVATINRTKKNSDGSLPVTQKEDYRVISDLYEIKYDIGYTLNKRESSFPDRVTKYNNDVAKLQTRKDIKFQYTYSGNEAIPYNKYNSYGGNLAIIDRRGYDFSGWYTVPVSCMTTYNRPNATMTKSLSLSKTLITDTVLMNNLCNQTLRAEWTPKKFTVYFNSNGRDSAVNPTSKIVTYDETYGVLPEPTRMGYTFLGWYTSTIGGTQITSSTEVDIIANQTLYAHWKANNYTVTYDTGGSKVVTFDSSYGPLPTPYKSGWSESYNCGGCTCTTSYYYIFTGYYFSGNYGGFNVSNKSINSSTEVRTPYNHTLTAGFSLQSNTSTYCPPPPPPPTPPAPKPSTGSSSSGSSGSSSSSKTSCTGGCFANCGDALANGKDCSNKWNEAVANGASKEQANAMFHDQAQKWYQQADPNSTYNSKTGITTAGDGHTILTPGVKSGFAGNHSSKK